jgi:hypothetical protein
MWNEVLPARMLKNKRTEPIRSIFSIVIVMLVIISLAGKSGRFFAISVFS